MSSDSTFSKEPAIDSGTSATPETGPPAAPPKRRKPWAWVVFWIVVAAVGWQYRGTLLKWWNAKPTGAAGETGGRRAGVAGAAVPVVVARVVHGSVPLIYRGIGTVTAFYTDTLMSRVSGQIMKVDFQEGQMVHQGDVLIEIDKQPYQVALEQAQGQLEHDQAVLKDAQFDLARYQALWQQEIIPRQQLDSQQATVDEYEGAIVSDKAAIGSAQLNLQYATITAPITGRIGLRLVDPGNIVTANSTQGLAVITQVQPIAVLFSLPQEQLPQVFALLRNGGHPEAIAYDSTDAKPIAGGVLQTINNQIDPTTGTYQLKAVFPNTDNALFPNQFVNMHLVVGSDSGLEIVPPAAIERGPQGTYVFVVDPPNARGQRTVEMRNVQVTLTEGAEAGVSQGLQAGEEVVTEGGDKLEQGTRVTITQTESGTPVLAEGSGTGAGATAAAGPGDAGAGDPAATPPASVSTPAQGAGAPQHAGGRHGGRGRRGGGPGGQ